MTHEDFMRLAIEEASKCETDVPVGAILVRDGQVVAAAHNTRQDRGDPVGHAEINVLREAARLLGTRRLEDCTMYVTLEPCPMCAGAIALTRLKACYYGAPDAQMGCCGSVYHLPADPAFACPTLIRGGLLENEARKQLQSFFRHRRGDTAL